MNLNPEYRNGVLVTSEMKKVWQVQMELVKKLLEVCSKYNLRIWGGGGTMIGTVREHGYIPWDDDIDMLLFRPDYDKLISIAKKEFDHPYFFQCCYTEKNYIFGHSQLRMDGTSAILAGQVASRSTFHMGIFIDIFPYDAVPDNQEDLSVQLREREHYIRQMQHISNGWDIIHPITSIKYILQRSKLQSIYSNFENLFRKYRIEDNKYVSCFSFQVDPDHILQDKHWYDETLFLPFEDILMPIPKDYDRILNKQYGDYMSPRKEPTMHGSYLFLSATTPYQDYLREHKREIRRLQFNRVLSRIKHIIKR